MSDPDLRRELERLAARLARIERQLGIDSVEAASHAQETLSAPIEIHPVSRGVKDQAVHRLFTATEPTAPPVQPPLAPPSIPTVLDSASREVAPIEVPAAPLAPPAPPAAPPSPSFVDRPAPLPTVIPTALPVAEPSAFSPSRADGPSWEVLIGGKWMAWVGALVVILAAGFAVKVGIDQGWWGRLSPITRCMAIAGFGGLLLIAGEVALRRIGKAAAAGLISAGLGTLYLDAFATFRGFRPPLLTQQWAFILMAAVALGGFALTVRTRFLTIGVLSIVGGYLTPILLRGDSTHDVELLLYLTMLLGVSLALAGLMRTPFGALRFVALGCHLIVAFGWLVSNFDRWQMAMGFMSIWWVMILAEAVYTAMRNRGAIGNVVMTLIATAAYVTGGCVLLRTGSTASAAWTGAFAAMVAVLGGVAAVQFGSGVDALRGRTRRAMDLLSVALWLQFGVLVATAIALQFEHVGQTIGWLGLGLAAVEMGRRLPSRGVTIFGLIVGGVATVGVAARPALDAFGGSTLLRPLFDVIGFDVSTWALLAIANVIAMHAAALRLPATDGWRTVRVVLVALASMMWMGMCMHQSEGLVTTGAWLLYAVVLIALARFDFVRSVPWLQTGVVALAFTAGRWLVINALVGRADPNWRAGQMLAFVNWQMGLAIAIAGVGWWSCRLLARHERDRLVATQGAAQASTGGMLWKVALIVGAAFTLVAICFEIDRGVAQASLRAPMHVRQLLFTLAWAAGSVIVAIMARTLVAGLDGQAAISRTWLLRRFAWSVLAICAVKWVAWDAPWLLLTDRRVFHDLTPLLNLQMIVGLGLAGALALLPMVLRRARIDERSEQHAGSLLDLPRDLAAWMPVAACCIVLWGLSFEVDRLLTQAVPWPRWLSPFEPLQVRALWWTALWICGGVIMFLIGQARRQSGLIASAIVIAAISTIVWLAFDTLLPRLATGRPAAVTPIFNLQFAVGALCAVNLMMIAGKVRGLPAPHATAPGALDPRALSRVLIAGVGIIGLWLGSIEVDRIFDNDPMVRQAALSVWWALYAVGLVVLGFAQRLALVRYAGLALLSLAAVKVLIVDLASLDQLPRVLSFAAAGLLLILTSVVYARLSPRLLREHEGGASRHDPP